MDDTKNWMRARLVSLRCLRKQSWLKWSAPAAQCRYATSEQKRRAELCVDIDQEYIRNFSIVAHIDHGKSTLSDRLLELTKTIDRRNSNEQVLDTLEVERERGITVKAQTCSMIFPYKGQNYTLNLIDTPGYRHSFQSHSL